MNNETALEYFKDIYDKMLVLQKQLYLLESMLYAKDVLTFSQVSRLADLSGDMITDEKIKEELQTEKKRAADAAAAIIERMKEKSGKRAERAESPEDETKTAAPMDNERAIRVIEAEILEPLKKEPRIPVNMDKIISLHRAIDCIRYADEMAKLPDCNTCGDKMRCGHRPPPGAFVRVNCPLYVKE